MVLPPTTYEQRESLYSDLRELLLNGFISHKVRLSGSTIALRNLNGADNVFLNNCTFGDNDSEWKIWVIARSLWMIDGMILLGEKNSAYFAYQKLKDLSKNSVSRIYNLVIQLTQKANEQYKKIEPFSIEKASRALWQQCKQHPLPSDRISGLIGSETLGINLIQRIWVSMNTYQDEIEKEKREWANAKFIASASAPKGVEKINKKEQSAQEQETIRKKRFLDEFYYRETGVITDDEDKPTTTNRVIKSASTPDELEDEMRRWVSGEQDDHDRIVLAYKNKIKEKHEIELQERQQRIADVQREMAEEEENSIALSPLIGYTNDQLREILTQKGHSADGRKISKVMYQDQSSALYNKHVEQTASTGKLKVRDGKIVIKGEDNSLMEDMAKRTVKGGVKDNE